ncbi:MAG: hypothetical protein KAJ13_08195, partial [Gemmatimonadetes bacterium]|nr:hypothetical protein [Gemmatimonadota bacterium]
SSESRSSRIPSISGENAHIDKALRWKRARPSGAAARREARSRIALEREGKVWEDCSGAPLTVR